MSVSSEDAITKIDRLVRECSEMGWDGYSAAPLSPEAAELAKRLAIAAKDVLPWAGNLVPDALGGLAWEWSTPEGTYYVAVDFVPKADLPSSTTEGRA